MTYYKKIDGLRCMAISAVLVHHIASIFSSYIDLGYFGVDLFFVISGFLITLILLKSSGTFKVSYCRFLARRTLRIFPLYYFAILVLVIVGNPGVLDNIKYFLTYTFNYRYPFITQPNPLGHFWSLSVEEQYYLFWPIIVLALRRWFNILLLIILLIISFGYLQIHFNIVPSISVFNYTGLPARMGSLGLGSMGAMLFLRKSKYLKQILEDKYIEIAMYLFSIGALVLLNPFFMGLCSLFFVLKSAEDTFQINFISRFLEHKKVLYIGRISYGLYVYHIIVIFYFTPYIFDPLWKGIHFEDFGRLSVLQYHSWLIKLPLYTVLTIIISEISYRYFENPILKLKKHFSTK